MASHDSCAVYRDLPQYAEAIVEVLATRGVPAAQLRGMPPAAIRGHVISAAEEVLAHELCELGCPESTLELFSRLLEVRGGCPKACTAACFDANGRWKPLQNAKCTDPEQD